MPSLPSFPTSRRAWIKLTLVLLLVLGHLGGAIWGWSAYKAYQASPEMTVKTLNKAIADKDFALWNTVVQSQLLATQLADAMESNPAPSHLADNAKTPIFAPTLSADAKNARVAAISTVLQELFQSAEKLSLDSIIPVLPEDPLQQLALNPFILRRSDSLVIAESSITLPLSPQPLPLRFLLQQVGSTWQITRLLNAPELAKVYSDAVMAELIRRKEKEGLSLEQNRKALTHYVPDARCQAGVTRISGGIPLLVLNILTAPNPGPETMDNWGFVCELRDASGNIVARPRTNSTIKVPQDAPIKESWSPEISEEQFLMLTAAGPLTCQPIPEYILLNSGQIFKDPQK